MTPRDNALRLALRAGHWNALHEVALSSALYRHKAMLGLAAAEEAAGLLGATRAGFRCRGGGCYVDGTRVLVSPVGTGAESTGNVLALQADGESVRFLFPWEGTTLRR